MVRRKRNTTKQTKAVHNSSAFHLACTEVIQDEVKWMLKSVENQEENQHQHACG